MPYIQPNLFLQAEKLIKPYECAMIVVEGPNLKGKINLDGLEIKYENYTLSQLVLNPESSDQPMLYGFLGNNITFLMVRAKYMPMDPNWAIEPEQYIEYYFKDDPGKVRQMGQLMILSGNSVKRLSQIYFNNPSTKNKVYLEVLMANLSQDDLTDLNQYKQNSSFSGLYYNSIISDSVNYIIPSSTGSTELKVIDSSGTLIIIPYVNIRSISKIDSLTLLIGLDTEEKIRLTFLSAYNCCQANSRINWVLQSQRNRILTSTQPPVDLIPPVISYNSILTGTTTGITSGTTTLYMLQSGTTYTTTDLKNIFISNVIDGRDGNIDKQNVTVNINALNDLVTTSSITNVGVYEVVFSITDLACNVISQLFYVSIYTESNGVFTTGYWIDSENWNDLDIWVD